MSDKAVSIGGATNASSLTPHRDPLDFLCDFVLNHEKPVVALNMLFFSLIKHTRAIENSPAPTGADFPEESGEELKKIVQDFVDHRAAAKEFLSKCESEYPEDDELPSSFWNWYHGKESHRIYY